MRDRPQRWELVSHALCFVACGLLGWYGVAEANPVPVLTQATYGFHEAGHLLGTILPESGRVLAGPVFQVLVPLALAAYFLVFRRFLAGASLMFAWAATAMREAALYIADAPYQTIVLGSTHPQHDWAILLGPSGLDRLEAAGALAGIAETAATVLVIVGLVTAAWGVVRVFLERDKTTAAEAYLQRRPSQATEGFGAVDQGTGLDSGPLGYHH
jgi:hypothetical protein